MRIMKFNLYDKKSLDAYILKAATNNYDKQIFLVRYKNDLKLMLYKNFDLKFQCIVDIKLKFGKNVFKIDFKDSTVVLLIDNNIITFRLEEDKLIERTRLRYNKDLIDVKLFNYKLVFLSKEICTYSKKEKYYISNTDYEAKKIRSMQIENLNEELKGILIKDDELCYYSNDFLIKDKKISLNNDGVVEELYFIDSKIVTIERGALSTIVNINGKKSNLEGFGYKGIYDESKNTFYVSN